MRNHIRSDAAIPFGGNAVHHVPWVAGYSSGSGVFWASTTPCKMNLSPFSLGMDVLRCKTPDMVTKEILMYLIAYNAIRLLMNNAGKSANVARRQISFKASVQALRQWEPALSRQDVNSKERRRLMAALYEAIIGNLLIERAGRQEPRYVKRRPKPYGLLTTHRHEMIEVPHRNRYRAKAA